MDSFFELRNDDCIDNSFELYDVCGTCTILFQYHIEVCYSVL